MGRADILRFRMCWGTHGSLLATIAAILKLSVVKLHQHIVESVFCNARRGRIRNMGGRRASDQDFTLPEALVTLNSVKAIPNPLKLCKVMSNSLKSWKVRSNSLKLCKVMGNFDTSSHKLLTLAKFT